MPSKLKKRIAPGRKLLLLRSLADSKSVRKDSIILDAFLYIYKLKLKLEAMQREYSRLMAIKEEYLRHMNHMHIPQWVKVEKAGKGYVVKVTCEKGKDKLVSILEAFEEMGLNVSQAKVNCNSFFSMDAIVVAREGDQHSNTSTIDVKDLTQALCNAIGQAGGKGACDNLELV